MIKCSLEQGLVINAPGERMLRFLPPLVIGEAEIDEALERLASALGSSGPGRGGALSQ